MILKRTNKYIWTTLVVLCLVASSKVFAQQWGPLLTTNWHQGDHFDRRCPLLSPGSPDRCAVGCVATAMAQIINRWEYPASVQFSPLQWPQGDAYMSSGNAGPIDIDGDAWPHDFPELAGDRPGMPSLNTALATINYDGDQEEEAYLCFGAGVKVNMGYGSESGADTGYTAVALTSEFFYGSANRDYKADVWTRRREEVIQNIKNGWPVQIAIGITGGFGGHSVVVDGYRESDGFFHVNMGWSGTAEDRWYDLPNIGSFDLITKVVYDICPYNTGQYGADPCNTRRTPYNGPEDHLVKWIVDTHVLDPETELATAIVGAGGNVYAFCKARTNVDPGRLFVITPYGVVVRNISIPAPADLVSEPAQASSPGVPIYISFNNKVYRISREGDVDLFYEDADDGEEFLYPTKVDPDGNVYVTGWNRICSINPDGQVRWRETVPNSSSMDFSAGVAIDRERARVYAKYYDPDNSVAHLWALNKDTGLEVWDMPVPAVPSPMAAAGEPTVDDDGTIYARFFKNLRAYNPDGSFKWEYNVNASQEWLEPFVSVGPLGNIYVCGSNFISTPKYAWVRSIEAEDKQLLWEFQVPYPSDESYYTFGAPVIALGNSMVYSVFKELASPGYQKLYALQETVEDTVSQMWEHDGADSILLGTKGAAYLLKRESEQIIALSGGAVGDPDEAGMGFTNNEPALSPSSPTPADGTEDVDSDVMLSWECSDPESHALKYSVFVGESGYDMIPVATDITNTSYALSNLRAGTGYAWKIIATDGQAVTEGSTWVFATEPPTVEFAADGSSGSEAVSPATLAVNLSGASGETVTVDYSVTGGTAIGGGVDYTLASGTLTFSPDDTVEDVQIAIVDDSLDEADETVVITLSNPNNATLGANTTHTYTIIDDDIHDPNGMTCKIVNLTQLTDGPIQESEPTFNVDGTKIAYRNLHEPHSWDNCDIWVMNVDGSGKTQITTDSRGEFGPSFVPNGRITYAKEFGSNDYDVWIVNPDGSDPHQLIAGSYRQTLCRWHPGGNKFVYCSEYTTNAGEIWTADADGSNQVKLTDHLTDGYHQSDAVYSRSGNLIAYADYTESGAPAHVWVMNADGTDKRQITSEAGGQAPRFWWPQDSSIGYTQNGELWLHDLDTDTNRQILKVTNGTIGWADLSTDGSKVVFDLSDANGTHVWTGDVIFEPQTFTIGGAIYEDPNNPMTSGVDGVTVTVAGTCGTYQAITTGVLGLWEIADVNEGYFTVTPSKTGYRFEHLVAGQPDGQSSLQIMVDQTYEAANQSILFLAEQESSVKTHDWNGDGIVSIVGDVPPFVNCVYFQSCPDGVDTIAVGDCNGDGILSIVGDVPCFVDCVYFGNCDR